MEALIPFAVFLGLCLLGIAMVGIGLGTREEGQQTHHGDFLYHVTNVSHRRPYLILWGNILIWPSLVLFIIYLPTFLRIFLTSWGDVKAMEAFYHDTLTNYEYSVTATEQVEIRGYAPQDGTITDFTYQQQGMAASDRIREMRDKTEWYNRTLRRLESANSVPVVGWLFHDVPDELKPIVLD